MDQRDSEEFVKAPGARAARLQSFRFHSMTTVAELVRGTTSHNEHNYWAQLCSW